MPLRTASLACVIGVLLASLARPAWAAEEIDLHIVYTGDTGGVSAGYVDAPEVEALPELLRKDDFPAEVLGMGASALLRDGRYLLRADENATVEELREALESNEKPKLLNERHPVLLSPFSVVTAYPPSVADELVARVQRAGSRRFPDLQLHHFPLYELREGGAPYLLLETRPGWEDLPLEPNLLAWESKFVAAIATDEVSGTKIRDADARIFVIARFLGGGPKMVQAMRDLQLPAERTLRVDAGASVEGAGRPDETLGRARDLSFRMLGRLGYDAMAPAAPELAEGLDALEKVAGDHALRYVAADLVKKRAADASAEDGPPETALAPWVELDRDGITVLVIGLVGPEARRRVKPSLLADYDFLDPVVAVGRALEDYRKSGGEADMAVVITAAPPDVVNRLEHNLQDIDVIIADFGDPTALSPRRRIEFSGRRAGHRRHRRPLLVSRSAGHKIGVLTASFRREGRRTELVALDDRVDAITEDYERDEGLRQRLKRFVVSALYGNQAVLLPAPRQVFGDKARGDHYQPADFAYLIGHLSRDRASAQVAVMRQDPMLIRSVGPVNAYFVRNWLSYPESLRVADLTGTQLKSLAGASVGAFELNMSGFDPGGQGGAGEVGGRKLLSTNRYRVVMTDLVAEQPEVAAILAGAATEAVEGDRGLQDDVVADLGALMGNYQTHESWVDAVGERMVSGAERLDPAWFFAIRELRLDFNNYNAVNNQDFSEVRENRVTSASQNGIGAASDLLLTYDGPEAVFDFGGGIHYNAFWQKPEGSSSQQRSETQDDVRALTEIRWKVTGVSPLTGWTYSVQPLLNATYNTEVTRNETDAGELSPRKSVYASNLGAALVSSDAPIRELRAAGVVRWDLAADELDPGLELSGNGQLELPGQVTWTNEASLTWIPTYDDDRDQTDLVVRGRSSFSVPLLFGVQLKTYVDAYVFRGLTDAGQRFGSSIVYNLALSYSRTYDLTHGVSY